MRTILCPTRGGESSTPNQEVAIQIAVEESAQLIFLYISNVHFLDHASGPVALDVIETQLDEVGEFILAIAEERAARSGLEARGIVLRGDFRTALEEAILEHDVGLLVFGSAVAGTGSTTPDYNRRLFDHLITTHRVEIIVTREGTILERLAPDRDHDQDHGEDNPA